MASTTQVRAWWSHKRCSYGIVMDPAWTWGRSPVRVQPEWIEATKAVFFAIPASGYVPETNFPAGGFIGSARRCPRGISGHDCEPSGSWCSLHNYVVGTFDIEYDVNKHLKVTRPDPDWMFARCKFEPENIEAIEAIRTNSGKQVFRWLGWSIADTMHVQGNVSPADLATGIDWTTVLGWTGAPPVLPDIPPTDTEEGVFMAYAKKGDDSEAVAEIQTYLLTQKYDLGAWGPAGDGVDGDWGSAVTSAVTHFQSTNSIIEFTAAGNAIPAGEYWGPRTSGFVAGQDSAASVGPKGDKGDTGAKGATGARGPKGDDGEGIGSGTVLNLSTEATVI